MTRITAPTPTRGRAPSHAPPDMRYAPGYRLARALGWFSVGLGAAEILAPRAMAELTGIARPGLIASYGLREILTGLGILHSDRPTGWLWARVAGDAIDLATLGGAMLDGDDDSASRARTAAAAVAGVAALDVVCSLQLSAAASLEG